MSAGSHAGAAAPSRPLGGSEAAPCATLGPSQGGRSSLDRGRRRAVAQAAENAFTDAVMAGSAPLQQELFAEIMACLPASDRSTPQRQGGFWYYSYRRAGGAYRVHCRCARGPATGPPSCLEPAPAGSRARAMLSIRRLCSPATCVGATRMYLRAPASALHVRTCMQCTMRLHARCAPMWRECLGAPLGSGYSLRFWCCFACAIGSYMTCHIWHTCVTAHASR